MKSVLWRTIAKVCKNPFVILYVPISAIMTKVTTAITKDRDSRRMTRDGETIDNLQSTDRNKTQPKRPK